MRYVLYHPLVFLANRDKGSKVSDLQSLQHPAMGSNWASDLQSLKQPAMGSKGKGVRVSDLQSLQHPPVGSKVKEDKGQ